LPQEVASGCRYFETERYFLPELTEGKG